MLLYILERLTGDCRTALERELLEQPHERNGTAWNGTGNNCMEEKRERNGPLKSRSMDVQWTGNRNSLLMPTVRHIRMHVKSCVICEELCDL